MLEGSAFFRDGRTERLGPRGTVLFPAGEAPQAESVTRMVLYGVQAGADRSPAFFAAWPPT